MPYLCFETGTSSIQVQYITAAQTGFTEDINTLPASLESFIMENILVVILSSCQV
jgi:hypothetical protein